jgi:hypothetical protein
MITISAEDPVFGPIVTTIALITIPSTPKGRRLGDQGHPTTINGPGPLIMIHSTMIGMTKSLKEENAQKVEHARSAEKGGNPDEMTKGSTMKEWANIGDKGLRLVVE